MPARAQAKTTAAVPTRTMMIEGTRVDLFDELVPLKDVRLDPANPRIQHAVKQKFGSAAPTREQLADLIYSMSGVSDLFKNIRDAGGLQESIYILDDGTVIEGNCRTACFIRLAKAEPGNPRWKSIQCIRLPKITGRQIAVLQGQFHVAGKIKWRAAEKAGHIYSMQKVLGMDAKSIASALGMQERTIKRLLEAYEFFIAQILPQAKGKNVLALWSYAEEYFKNSELNEHRTDPKNVKWFATQVVSGKIKRGDDVRKLPRIVRSKPAMRALEKGGVSKAISVVSKKDPTADSVTLKKIKDTTLLLEKIEVDDMYVLKQDKPNKLLLALVTAAQNVLTAVKSLPNRK